MSENEFLEDVQLDVDSLDDANIMQASLYAKWGRSWAIAVKERDEIKERKEVVRADLDSRIRNRPEKYGWEGTKSPTETFISNTILLQQAYQDISQQLIEAQQSVNLMSVAKEAMDHKGRRIDSLIELEKIGWFSHLQKEKPSRKEGLSRKNTEAQNDTLKKNKRLRKEE